MKKLNDRVAVVTGAAGGIGRATALRLAGRGCRMAVADIAESELRETARLIDEAGGRVSTHVVDVADRARMQAFADEVAAAHGAVHIVVNNAGVSIAGPFEEQSLEDWDWIVGVNFWGVIHGCKFFLPYLRQVDEAHIVNVSSMFGFIGVPLQAAYSATKFAVRGFSEALFAELSGTHVGVSSIHPGGIRTRIAHDSRTTDPDLITRAAALFDEHGADPDTVAVKIVDAIERRKLRALVRPEAYVTDWIKRMFPVTTHRLMATAFRRSEFGGDPKP